MEFPLNEQNQYPLIKHCVEKIFASRVKPVSEKIVELWITEIIDKGYKDEVIERATQKFIESEEYNLSLPVFLRLIKENNTESIRHNAECTFCEGRGTVVTTLAFNLDGTIIDCAPYMLNCYCNKNGKLLQMIPNKKTFNKTYSKDKYFRVFPSIVEMFAYQEKVWANGNKDINA